MNPKLLIVDDNENIRTQMKWALAQDYDVHLAENRQAAVEECARNHPQVVLLDLGLPPSPSDPTEGFATLGEILAINPFTKVIVITGQGEKENALRAIGEGAYDFLNKPIDAKELEVILKRAYYTVRLESEHREFQNRLGNDAFEGMLGTSEPMQEVFACIRKVAITDAPILILGESGTGKEMAAQAIHRRSQRKDGPFVAINCGAIPENLLESELFGHEKGAFTGAHVQRKGRIETAEGGTLFFDEIGELPSALQVKLLRFLQEHRLIRVGGREDIEIDARLIAATNTNLKKDMAEGRFREDLYFRLAVIVIEMPPLRQRGGDVTLLATAFLKKYTAMHNKSITGFNHRAKRLMETHDWPGNVREMENRIMRAVIMAGNRHRQITDTDLELNLHGSGGAGLTLQQAREALEKEMIQKALTRHKGVVSRAADELQITRPTLYDMMTKLGLKNE
jgi:two-component system, NtrC family, response regulator